MTDDCGTLITTGVSASLFILLAIVLMTVALVLLSVSRGASRFVIFSRLSVLLLVANIVIGSAAAIPAMAAGGTADNCIPTTSTQTPGTQVLGAAIAAPDTSAGEPGQVQRYSVVANDTPSNGALFDLSTLRLALVPNPVAGSVLSANTLMITAPTEGVYNANTDGTISYTPETNFLGTGRGVAYTIEDTSGKIAGSTFIPTVTASALVCVDPASETRVLPETTLNYSNLSYTGASTQFSLASSLNPKFADLDMSSDGTKLAGVGDYAYTSANSGHNWTQHTGSGTDLWTDVSMSADGTIIMIARDFGEPMYSIDSGITWSVATLGAGYWHNAIVSADGSKMYAMSGGNSNLHVSTNYGLTWTNLGLSPGGTNMAASDDGQHLVMTAYPSGIHVSTDGGASWTVQPGTGTTLYGDLAMSADGQTLYLDVIYGGIRKSTDGGVTWTTTNSPGTAFWGKIKTSANGQIIFAVDSDNDVLYRSGDGGTSWAVVASAESGKVAVDSTGQNVVLVSKFGHISTSTDSGQTWTLRYDTGINPASMDIDPDTAGTQYTIDKTATEGWSATFDPITDIYRLEVTDSVLFQTFYYSPSQGTTGYNLTSSYTLQPLSACNAPPSAQINIIFKMFNVQ